MQKINIQSVKNLVAVLFVSAVSFVLPQNLLAQNVPASTRGFQNGSGFQQAIGNASILYENFDAGGVPTMNGLITYGGSPPAIFFGNWGLFGAGTFAGGGLLPEPRHTGASAILIFNKPVYGVGAHVYDDGTTVNVSKLKVTTVNGGSFTITENQQHMGDVGFLGFVSQKGITRAEFMTDGAGANPNIELDHLIVVTTPPGCSNCTQAGCSFTRTGSIEYNLGLGQSDFGNSFASLYLDEDLPSSALATPAKLQYSSGSNIFIKKLSNGSLRQVKTADTLADIVSLNPFSYEIRLYTSANAGSPDSNGLYVPVGTYFKKVLIENPDGNSSFNRLKISETGETEIIVNEFVYDSSLQQWELVSGNGLVRESRRSVIDPISQDRIETHMIRNQDFSVALKEINTFHSFAWGEEKIKHVLDPDGAALTLTWAFISTQGTPGYGEVREIVEPTGYWERYEYDALGRRIKTVSQYLDAPLNAVEDLSRVTATFYNTNEPQVTTVEILLGQEISRHYTVERPDEIREIQAQKNGVAYDNPENLVTITKAFDNFSTFIGRTKSIENPDGTMSLYSYSLVSNKTTTTVKTGTPNVGKTDIIDGTRTVIVVDAKGTQLSNSVYDIKSGLLLSSSIAKQFDSLGRPTRVEYNNGTFTTTSYNCCGSTTETDQEGIETVYTYDALKRVSSVTRAGITTRMTYNALGNVLQTIRIGNDGSEIITNILAYDKAGRLTSSQDALNRLTKYSEKIDSNGHTVKTTIYPDNTKRIETYFQDGSLLSISGNAVHPVKYEYGFEPVFPQDPLPPPDEPSRFTKEIRIGANGAETEWTKTYFDMLGRPYKTVLSNGGFFKSFFNNKGQLVRVIDPDGVGTLFNYNAKGELIHQAADVDSNREIGFDGKDRITQINNEVVEKNGITVKRTTTKVYTTPENSTDTKTISVVETTPDGLQVWEDSFGLVRHTKTTLEGQGKRTVIVTDPDGTVTTSKYLNGQIISSDVIATDLFISSKSYQYDPHGRLSMITDEQGVTTNGVFYDDDKLKLIIMIGGSDGKIQNTAFNYDVMGRLTTTTENGLAPVSRTYWPTGELKSLSGFGTYPQSYTYDTQGRLKTLKTGNNANTTWNYNPVTGLLMSKIYSNGKGPSYTYSPAGRLLTRTWARGIVTTYGYNFVGDLVEITYSDGTPRVAFSIDRMARITEIHNAANGAQILSYNDANLPLSEEWLGGPLDGYKVINTYDALQRRVSVGVQFFISPPSVNMAYEYDFASRIKTVSDALHGTKTNYTYIPNSSLIDTMTFENNGKNVMKTKRSYDGLSRLKKINSTTQLNPAINFAYTYNAANERSRVNLTKGRWLYEYDGLGQVISGKKFSENNNSTPVQDFRYSFDQIGNRTSNTANGSVSTYQANKLNQYTSQSNGATSEAFNYDADGNLVKDGRFKYTWDAENRLITVETYGSIPASSKMRREYVYDPFGRRITKKEFEWNISQKKFLPTGAKLCIYDGWNMIAQHDTSGALNHSYVWGLDLSGSMQGAGGVGGLLTIYNGSDGTSHAYAYDGNGNVSSLVNMSNRQISAQYEYGPFGETVSKTGPMADINPYQFSTKYKDNETGLLYYGYRYLNPSLGRWLSRDPIEENGGLNIYGFLENDGISRIDKLGLEECKCKSGKWKGDGIFAFGQFVLGIARASGSYYCADFRSHSEAQWAGGQYSHKFVAAVSGWNVIGGIAGGTGISAFSDFKEINGVFVKKDLLGKLMIDKTEIVKAKIEVLVFKAEIAYEANTMLFDPTTDNSSKLSVSVPIPIPGVGIKGSYDTKSGLSVKPKISVGNSVGVSFFNMIRIFIASVN